MRARAHHALLRTQAAARPHGARAKSRCHNAAGRIRYARGRRERRASQERAIPLSRRPLGLFYRFHIGAAEFVHAAPDVRDAGIRQRKIWILLDGFLVHSECVFELALAEIISASEEK